MFGKKKDEISLMHYEGIAEFATDYPVKVKLDAEMLTIKRIKPETTVTLERSRIKSISVIKEENFMLKYHGQKITTGRSGITKYYMVIQYDKGQIVFWGTAMEYKKMLDFEFNQDLNTPSHISL